MVKIMKIAIFVSLTCMLFLYPVAVQGTGTIRLANTTPSPNEKSDPIIETEITLIVFLRSMNSGLIPDLRAGLKPSLVAGTS